MIAHQILCQGLRAHDGYETLCPREWTLLYLVIQRILSEKTLPGTMMALLGAHIPYIRLFPANMLTRCIIQRPNFLYYKAQLCTMVQYSGVRHQSYPQSVPRIG